MSGCEFLSFAELPGFLKLPLTWFAQETQLFYRMDVNIEEDNVFSCSVHFHWTTNDYLAYSRYGNITKQNIMYDSTAVH